MSHDEEITTVTAEINRLLDDLTDTVAALNTILTGSPPSNTGTEDRRYEQPRP